MLSSIVMTVALAWQVTNAQPKGVRLEQIAWPEAEALLHANAVVVIPLGGAAVEHGPHLKLGNDARLAEYFARRVVDASAVVVAPALPYHYYPAFTEYPGSTSLPLATAHNLTADVVRSLARFGPRRFYVLNIGAPDTQPLQLAAKALAGEGILLHYTEYSVRLAEASRNVRQQEGGSHADESETSMMLYIDGSQVEMKRAARDFSPASSPFRLTQSGDAAGTYSPTGIWGNATLASRDKGRVIVDAMVKTILDEIETLRATTLPSRTPPPPAAPKRTTAPPRSVTPGLGAPEKPTCTPGDERRIREIGEIFSVAWTNQDVDKLGALWTLDGDIVHPDGYIERGRRIIMEHRRELFTRREYRQSRHPLTLAMIRCVTADVAVADGKWELRGVLDNTGKALPIMEGLVTVIATRGGGGWQIEAYRYTFKPATVPLPPTILKRPGYPGGQ